MSSPAVQSASPVNGSTGVFLGSTIEIVFDQPIDQDTVDESTFSLSGPGQTSIVDYELLASGNPLPLTGREYITGKFDFSTPGKVVFTPGRPLRPNVEYSVLLVGGDSQIALNCIKNPAGEPMISSYQFKFTTGELNLSSPPVSSPLQYPHPLAMRPALNPQDIIVRPRMTVGNDLLSVIELEFPGEIDPDSVNPADMIAAVEPILNDPQTPVPADLQAEVRVEGNKILITFVGW